jgi:hypothetical protein
MKKKILITVLVLAIAGGAFAQASGTQNSGDKKGPEKATLNGMLDVKGGMIALEERGATYYLIGLNRFTGFIDGLKAGVTVKLEGFNAPLPPPPFPGARSGRQPPAAVPQQQHADQKFFRVTKLTLGGKDYELAPANMGPEPRMRPGFPPNTKNHPGNFRDNRNDRGYTSREHCGNDYRHQRSRRN